MDVRGAFASGRSAMRGLAPLRDDRGRGNAAGDGRAPGVAGRPMADGGDRGSGCGCRHARDPAVSLRSPPGYRLASRWDARGAHGAGNHERYESTGVLVLVCFVCFVDHKAPSAVVPGLQIRSGSMGFWVGNRWCRFAQPPATGRQSFGMTGDGNAAGDGRAPGVGGGRARGATHHGELGLVDGVIAPMLSRWGGENRGGHQRGRGIVAGFIRSQPGLDAAMP